jgi:uncharacterized hydrophobic protein (TIGR00271 family)
MSKEQREQVRDDIHNGATLSLPYISMNILAATIACYGLFANSPAVIIGAMIVAMLLGPITGVSLALVDGNNTLLRMGLITLLVGAAVVMITAFILGLIHHDIPPTNEIMGRTSPNLFDLMIALAGGAAGAYASVSPRLSVAFVGVAISTALVPPLSSASILFARNEYQLGFGAFLLAFTNMVAIQFASSVVLWLTGFRQVTRTQGLGIGAFLRRNLVSIVILIGLAVILTGNLHNVISRQLFESSVKGILRAETGTKAGFHLAETRFETTKNSTIVRAVIRGPHPPTAQEVATIENKLPKPPGGTNIVLRVRFVDTMTINRDGLLFTDNELGKLD